MNIGEEVTKFIEGMGTKEAALFFDRKESTINTWVKTNSYPQVAIQKWMDATYSRDGASPAEEKPEAFVGAEPSYQESVQAMLNDLNFRLTHVEVYLKDGGATQPSLPPPVPQAPGKQWYEADPTTVGFGSSVRPGDTVPTKAVFGAPPRAGVGNVMVPVVQQSNAPTAPSNVWLKPRPLK